jgi:hypothetical protein
VRRAINLIKDRVASLDWQVRLKRDYTADKVGYAGRKAAILRRTLEEPNDSDSFRTLVEQVLEDALVGGFGAIEMELTDKTEKPFALWPVDGATIQINPKWDGSPNSPRYAQSTGLAGSGSLIPLNDDQLIYLRLNPRTHTPFGLGPLEVAFETVNTFLSAHRFAGKLASNAVVQYALWLDETSQSQHERLIRWWQDEIEGTGRVPILSTEQKPEVLRFAQGTDADLRLSWQEFLIRMVAIKTSSTVPADTWLPQQPEATLPLDNLSSLVIPSVTASAIQISTNATPPAGGGFEVRRRDWAFGPGTDSDLVLRSPVANFSIPREAVMEQYYVRMYDGSTHRITRAFRAPYL